VTEGYVDTVRRIYDRWGRGDFSAGMELYDPYVVLVLRPEFPESGPHWGRDGIERYMRDEFLRDFADASISGEEFLDAGDSVVVRVDQRATGPRSGAPVRMRYYQVWTFRGDAVIRIESIMERSDALRAAGLGSDP
jgi:ketosteroid isomerase-like protein